MGGMQAGPQAYGGQQGGQPFYNLTMMQPAEDPYQAFLRRQGTQLGAGQVSGGLGSAAGGYPALGGGQGQFGASQWTPSAFDPNLLGGGGGAVVTKPGGELPGVTDPVIDPDPYDPNKPGPVVNRPIERDIPDPGPNPNIPDFGDHLGGDMTLPDGTPGRDTPDPSVPDPNRRVVTKGGGVQRKPAGGPPLGPLGTGISSLSPDIQKTSWSLNDPTNRTVTNPFNTLVRK